MMRYSMLFALILAAGCVGPSPSGISDSSYYIGDRATCHLKEIVVGMKMPGQQDVFKNVHICLTAVINSEKFLPNYDNVRAIIERSEARIASEVVEEVTRDNAAGNIDSEFRNRICNRAQKAFQRDYDKWASAKDYRVEILLTSIYVSDNLPGKKSLTAF